MYRSLLVLTVTMLTLPLALAEPLTESQCTPLDLRSEQLGEVRDTKDMNWSYAHAAADLLTLQLDLPEGQRISAEALAIELQTTHPLQNISDAMSDRTFFTRLADAQGAVARRDTTAARVLEHHRNNEKPLCLESEVGTAGYEGADLTEVFNLIDDAATLYRGRMSKSFNCNSSYGEAYGHVFPALGVDEIVQALAKSTWSSTKNFVELKNQACKTQIQFPQSLHVISEKFSFLKANNYLSSIHRGLQAGRGAMLALDESTLTGSTRSQLSHSTVVGRRFEGGVCQLLVRTTRGADCSQYKPNLTCEDGHIWISEVDLRPAIKRVVTLIQ